jgi:hypothetical protein
MPTKLNPPISKARRRTNLPIRPKPLMPTLIAISGKNEINRYKKPNFEHIRKSDGRDSGYMLFPQ